MSKPTCAILISRSLLGFIDSEYIPPAISFAQRLADEGALSVPLPPAQWRRTTP